MNRKQWNDVQRIAAAAKRWYLMRDGTWQRLTLTEARRLHLAGKVERPATVDEDLKRDGI